MKKLVPEWWNINGLNKDTVSRTNNPLEQYDGTLNDAFSNPHPDVIQFIAVNKKLSHENVWLVTNISKRRATVPARASAQRAPGF